MMTRKFSSIRKLGPRAPAGTNSVARSPGRGNAAPPGRVAVPRPFVQGQPARRIGKHEVEALRQHDFVAPGLARLPSGLHQMVRRRGNHIGDRTHNIAPTVAIEVDRIALERRRHELGRAERTRPGTLGLIGLYVAPMQDFQCGKKLVLEIGLRRPTQASVAVERITGRSPADRAVFRLDAPDRHDDVGGGRRTCPLRRRRAMPSRDPAPSETTTTRACGPSPRPALRNGSSSTARQQHASAANGRSRPAATVSRSPAPPCGRAPTRPLRRTPSAAGDRRRAPTPARCRPAARPRSTRRRPRTAAAPPARHRAAHPRRASSAPGPTSSRHRPGVAARSLPAARCSIRGVHV